MPSDLIKLSELLGRMHVDGSHVEFPITEDWLQGRTSFGGLLGVVAVMAMREVVGREWPAEVELKALQTNFVGPVGPGTVRIEVQKLREGKNVRQVKATAWQGNEVGAVFVGVFAVPRDTTLPELMPEIKPIAKLPEDLNTLAFFRGLTPNFTQHVEMRWAEGSMPFTGGDTWHAHLYLRLRTDEHSSHLRYWNELLTVMLADAAPTPAIGRISGPCPASSVSWALELRTPHGPIAPDAWWRLDKDTAAAAHGYVNERATLWTPSGNVAAFGYQVVGVYG